MSPLTAESVAEGFVHRNFQVDGGQGHTCSPESPVRAYVAGPWFRR